MANNPPKGIRPPVKDETPPASPVATFRFGQVSAAVFADKLKLPSGMTATLSNVSLRRSYRNAAGSWEHTHSLRVADLLPAAFVLTKCADFIATSQATGADSATASESEDSE